MKRSSPFPRIAAAIVAAAICFGGGRQMRAQINPPPIEPACRVCLGVSDASCGGEQCDALSSACGHQSFQVPCDGNYCVRGSLLCSTADECHECQVCVSIFDENGVRLSGMPCHQGGTNPVCGQSCEISCCGIWLKAAPATYTLEVCKSACAPLYSCDSCSDGCVAWGWVHDPSSSCPGN